MAMAVRNTTNPEELQITVIHEIASLQGRSPSCDLVNNTRDYANKCAPIYSLAIRGEWKETEAMIDADRRLATSAISQGRATLLHVAAEANQLHFVKELVKLLSDEDLELQDRKGNTAFCLAAASGNVRIVKVMARRNSRLPTIRRGDGLTPLHMAALQGKNKMAWHLYHDTVQTFNDADWDALFFFCLKTDIYDLALKVLREKPRVALARNENQETGLHVLARKPSSFSCRGGLGQRFLYMLTNSGKSPTLALQLVKCLWETLLSLDGTEMQTIIKVISEPSQVIFIATEVGNFEVLAELVRSCPELMWEVDTKNRSIIHIAALHRHIDIYNLIHETSSIRNFVVTLEDEDKNNLLHYAAKLSPPSKLNLLPGPVLQMKVELMWYEEVKKIMQPCFIEMRNSNGKTPRELFTEEHSELVTKAESWMKSMINSCITISTVTATLVLATAFSIKREDNHKPTITRDFMLYIGIAMISSSISSLIFLSILITSPYVEEDFLKSLLRKIWWGLVTLYTSIAYLLTTFTIAFFTTYQVRVPKSFFWGPLIISALIMEYFLFPYGSFIIKNPRYWLPSKYIFYTGKAKGRVN